MSIELRSIVAFFRFFSVCLTYSNYKASKWAFQTDFEKKADWYEICDQDNSGVWQTSSKRGQRKQGSVCIETCADQIN